MLWQLRPGNKADESFVYSSWLKSHRDATMFAGVSNTIYYAKFHDLIENVLNDAQTAVIVACSPTDHDQIFGYCVANLNPAGNIVHWVYTKHPFRKFGVAKAMVAAVGPQVYTTRARPGSLVGTASYDPFQLLRYIKQ